MTVFLIYFLKVNLIIAILFMAYYFLLRKEKFFGLHRWILLSVIGLAFFLPLLPAMEWSAESRFDLSGLLLAVTSSVAVFGIALAYVGRLRAFDMSENTRPAAHIVNLNTIADPRQLEPVLGTVFANAYDRGFAARELFRFLVDDRGGRRTLQMRAAEICPTCNGTSLVQDKTCQTCGGSGQVLKPKTIEVNIPAGVRDGSTVRLAGQGGAGLNGRQPGDLYLRIRLRPHPVFTVRGDDLGRFADRARAGCHGFLPPKRGI